MNEKIITITEWIEAHCPYCRYVENSILRDIQARRIEINRKLQKQGHYPIPPLEIRLIDIEANRGSREMQWFQQYSQKVGGVFTPAIRVADSGKVFYLWGSEKKETLDKKAISNTDKLKADIIRDIQDILDRVDRKPLLYDKEFYNPKRVMEIVRPRVMYTPFGGF